MIQPDEVTRSLDLIARLLEANDYAIEVDYAGATIIVWTDHWPAIVEVRQRGERQDNREENEGWK